MPRAGSTLLSSILRQNPRFHSSITDPLANLVKGVIETCQDGAGIKTIVPETRRRDVVHALFDGFYRGVDQPVIFNTNRAWTLLTPQIDSLFPESKFLVCVRDVAWVLDSLETAHRSHPLSVNTLTKGIGGTVYSRCAEHMADDGIVGFPYIGIKQALTSEQKHKLMLIEYDVLCQQPQLVMQALYNFIDEPVFEHDFNDVEDQWDEYDSEIGIPMHRVRKSVAYTPRQHILPPDLLASLVNMEVWRR